MDLRLLHELEDDLVEDIIIQELLEGRRSRLGSKKRMHTSMAGHDYVRTIISHDKQHPTKI